MKRKLIVFSVIICLILGLNSASATNVNSVQLGIVPRVQEKSNWCWAASALMSASYLVDTTKTQTNVVTYTKGSPTDNTYGSVWETAEAVEMITMFAYDAITNYPCPMNFNSIKISLQNRRPVISLLRENGSGHFYVISGYDNSSSSLYVINPGDGMTYLVSYTDFHNGITTNGWRDDRGRVGDVIYTDWEG